MPIEITAIAAVVFTVWNVIVFAMYGLDKRKAQQDKWRTSESTLLLAAALMGGLGAFLGMQIFRHKTKHLKFQIGVPLSLVLNIIIIAVLIYIFVLR